MLERHPELRPAAAGSESGGRPGMMAQATNDSQRLWSTIEALQRQIQAMSANMTGKGRQEEYSDDEAPSYMAVPQQHAVDGDVQEDFCRQQEVEEKKRDQRRMVARMPESFKQLPGNEWGPEPVKTGGFEERGMQATEMARKLTETPCFNLADLGVRGQQVKAVLRQWWKQELPAQAHGKGQIKGWNPSQAPIPHEERMKAQTTVVLVDNCQRCVEVGGLAPNQVLIDSGAEPVILG